MHAKKVWISAAMVAALGLASLTLGACASRSASDGGQAATAAPAEPAQPAKAAPAKGVAPPADHRMAQLALNMSPEQVQGVMGVPTGQKNYLTGKAFNPFTAYGNDSGSRVEYAYQGEGRVVFAVPRWGGSMKVVRIDYDPTEDGN